MLDGPSVVQALRDSSVTHVVWIPDSTLGTWDQALTEAEDLTLIRVCREGEAFGVAAGLLLGGRRPLIMIQCTGLFEAGDSLRNFLHDLRLPLFLLIGLRNHYARQAGRSGDTAPGFAEPILNAWQVPYRLLERHHDAGVLTEAILEAREAGRAGAVLLAE